VRRHIAVGWLPGGFDSLVVKIVTRLTLLAISDLAQGIVMLVAQDRLAGHHAPWHNCSRWSPGC